MGGVENAGRGWEARTIDSGVAIHWIYGDGGVKMGGVEEGRRCGDRVCERWVAV